jgi:hypothetical protein
MPVVSIYVSDKLPPMNLAFFLAFDDFHSFLGRKVREILVHSKAYRPHTLPTDPGTQPTAVDHRNSTIRILHMSSPNKSPYMTGSQSVYDTLTVNQRYEGTNQT